MSTDNKNSEVLKKALLELKRTKSKLQRLETDASEPIAIIGMGCRFPGGVDSPEKLWDLLEGSVDAVSDMENERWDADALYDPDPEKPGMLYTKANGLVDDVDQFDNDFFNIAAVEAELMDPQQRLLMESSWNALEDAGIDPTSLAGSKTGVFVGICHQGYSHLQAKYRELTDVSPYDGTGNAHAIASGRVSYLLGLQGPSLSVDTACSSSLITLHLAVQSLRKKESDLGLAGGVNLILEPSTSMIFAKAGMLSPDGRCKTFDASANGYVRGEGSGMVVLKRLSDAKRDGDRVLAVIKGSAVNQDGKSQGITAPNELAQEKVLAAALKDANIQPTDVGYVEAHGTGTSLGDPIELAALQTVYGKQREADNPLVVGSIKTNIGHLEAAAGIAGLMKVVLTLQHNRIPQHLHFSEPNPYFDWQSSSISVASDSQDWSGKEQRLAGLSSFGFSGTNCHIIVGDEPHSAETACEPDYAPGLLSVSAKSSAALQEYLEQYIDYLAQADTASWAGIRYTNLVGRSHLKHRVMLQAQSIADAQAVLEQLVRGETPAAATVSDGSKPAKLAMVYTGQSAQFVGMGQALYECFPVFKAALDECAALITAAQCQLDPAYAETPLLSVCWGDHSHLLNETRFTQPAIFAVQYALTALWADLGVTPSVVTGHSIGEYAAAVTAGVMSVGDAATMIAARGHLMQTLCEPGAMATVFASPEQVKPLIDLVGSHLSIAAHNGKHHCVISGEKQAVDSAMALLSDENINARPLLVSHAFHSPMMTPMLDAFREVANTIKFRAPRIRFISTQTGSGVVKELADPEYWVSHIGAAVKFYEAGQALVAQKCGVTLEIGPGAGLTKMLALSNDGGELQVHAFSIDKESAETITIEQALAQLHCAGLDIRWRQLFHGSLPSKVVLPTYPYQRHSFWVDSIRVGQYSNNQWANLSGDCYQLEWRPLALNMAEGQAPTTHILWVGEPSNLQTHVCDRAASLSISTVCVDSRGMDSDGLSQALTSQLAVIAEQGGAATVVFSPSCVTASDSIDALSLEGVYQACDQFTGLYQAVERAAFTAPCHLWLLTEGSATLAPGAAVNLASQPLLGIAKSIALESPALWGGVVDVAQSDDPQAAARYSDELLREWQGGSQENTVALCIDSTQHDDAVEATVVRSVQRLQKTNSVLTHAQSLKDTATFDGQGTYLVTGGLGALGLRVAGMLASHGASHIVLVSRHGQRDTLSPAQNEAVSAMEAAGTQVIIQNADIANAEDTAALIAQCSSHAPLRGVVHAAGVSEICLLTDMTSEAFQRVTQAKIEGGWNLHQATATLSLDFFLLFSSIASVWGSGGMAHYSAGNQFLDGLMRHRQHLGLPASSVNWGPWSGEGMAKGEEEEANKRGLRGLAPEECLHIVEAAITMPYHPIVFADMDWDRFKDIFEARRPHPLLSHVGRSALSQSTSTGVKNAFFMGLYGVSLEERQAQIVTYLQTLLANVVGKDEEDIIDPELPLMDLGIDSIMALEIKKQLEADTGESIPATLIFDYPTINKISQHFSVSLFDEAQANVADANGSDQYHGEPIAIVGIGSRLPKAPNGPTDFWNLLKNGLSGIDDHPDQRWNIEEYLDTDPEVPGKTYTLSAGLIDDIEGFDGKLFGMAPREIESMEPQQRLVLEACWGALEHAGYAPQSMNGSNTGVFMGVGANEYIRACAENAREEDIMFIPTGNATNVISGRVAFNLGLTGPCMAIDTACSSSSVAIHTAVQSLRNGECDMALAGGVNAMIMPETFVALSKAHMLSKSGRCHTFDASADGYVRGEGVGVIALKRLSAAQRDSDPIIAVIKGSAMNQDGRSSSLTAPNGPSQQAVIKRALNNANVDAAEVDWVETHGTATPLGDPIEVQSIEAVYGASRSADNPLIISAVKTNIGHLESAAGVSSIIKAALALNHEYIPPHLNFTEFNPHIAVDPGLFTIPVEGMDWARGEKTRRAGVSSFGFSGTNVHMILEEAPGASSEQDVPDALERNEHVLTLSAKSASSLQQLCQRYAEYIEQVAIPAGDIALADIAHTANTARDAFEYKAAIVAKDLPKAVAKLKPLAEGVESIGAFTGHSKQSTANVAFLFSGQGAQYHGMALSLYEQQPAFKALMDQCDNILQDLAGWSLCELLWGSDEEQVNSTEYTQPAIFCLQYCLSQYWLSLGVTPAVMIGHSVGEYGAAVVAGILTLEDALQLIVARGRLMVELTQPGDMVAVLAEDSVVDRLLMTHASLQLAAKNAPNNIVLSGPKEAIAALIAACDADGIETRTLVVSHAFHSAMMEPMLDAFAEIANGITYQPATTPIISTVSGKLNQGEMSTPAYWVRQVGAAVLFRDALETLAASEEVNTTLALEIGPSVTLAGLGKQILADSEWVFLHSLRIKQDAHRQCCLALAQLSVRGVAIDWQAFDAAFTRQRVGLPSYAFDRKRYWLGDQQEGRIGGAGRSSVGVETENMLTMAKSPMSNDIFFENSFNQASPFNLNDHRLYEVVVAPGAFHVAMGLTCSRDVFGDQPFILDDVIFPEPLIFDETEKRRLHYCFTPRADTTGDAPAFEVKGFSREEEDDLNQWIMHTSMNATVCAPADTEQSLTLQDIDQIKHRTTSEVTGDRFYNEMWDAGYHLGTEFRWIEHIWRRPGEALTQLRLPASAIEKGKFLIHPGLMDSCFQSSILAAEREEIDTATLDAIYIPFAVENLHFYHAPTTTLWCHVRSKNPLSSPEEGLAESYTHNIQVYDETGRIIIDVEALHSKRAPKEALLKALRKDPYENHYQVHWKSLAVAEQEQPASLPSNVLVVAMEDASASQCVEQLRHQGTEVTYVQHTPSASLTEGAVTIADLSDLTQVQQVLALSGGEKAIDGVVYFAANNADDASIMAQQHPIYQPVLQLIKGIQQQGALDVPRLWCVTQGAVSVQRADEKVNPNHTGVLGFGKVLNMENPEFNAVFVDIDQQQPARCVPALIEELRQSPEENQVAIRRQGRWVARLARFDESVNSGLAIPPAPNHLLVEKKGTFDELKFVSYEPKEVGGGEVKVKVLSAGLNFRDVMGVLDVYPGEPGPLGGECVGEIISLGHEVTGFALGDQVMVPLAQSCMGSSTIIGHQLISHTPSNLTINEAATLPVAYSTALYGLDDLAQLKQGERVLIHAGAGGVGLAAIYIAQHMGAEVFATASEKKRDYLRSIGVKHVLDSRSLSFAQEIRDITDGGGVDVVLNSLAGEFITTSMALLNPGGRFIEIGKADIWSQDRVKAFRDDISYQDFDLVTVTMMNPLKLKSLMETINERAEQGHYKPLPYTLFTQKESVEAFRYMAQGKHIGKILIAPEAEPAQLSSEKSYLITGATGGLGLLFAQWMAEQGAGELILAARRDVASVAPEKIDALRALGVSVRCECVDIGDEAAVNAMFSRIAVDCKPLGGVIHGAGVLNDGFLMNQSMQTFEKVMEPKLVGAWHLHQATRHHALDFFVLFSSLSSLLGAPGQANYAAANGFLDGLATLRRKQGLTATAINWGPWSEVGMAANESVEANAKASGVNYISPTDGLAWFDQVLQQQPVQRGLIDVDWAQLANNMQGQLPKFLSELDVKASVVVDENLQKMAAQFREDLALAPIDERTPMLIEKICEQIMLVMGLEEDDIIDPNQPLQELGLDSLMAVELRNILCALINKQLPATLMFKYPTVASLSGFLIEDMFKDDMPEEEEAPITTQDIEEEEDESLDALSEAELEAMLSAELDDSDN